MGRTWQVAIVNDTAVKSLGGHGLHGAFYGLPGVEVVAHVDSNLENLEQKLATTGARRHYPTMEAMLAAETPDIVVLCSRHPHEHLQQIETVAAAGCHIYLEKPLTVTLPEADRAVQLAEQHNVRICLAHPARYAPAFLELKRIVEAGEIGRPLTVYGRGKSDHRGGGEDLITLGTHILDYMTFVFGPPKSLWADVTEGGQSITAASRTETVEPLQPAAGDAVFAVISFADGVHGLFESRRGLAALNPGVVRMGVTVHGTEGTLSMRFNDPGWPDPGLRLSKVKASPEDETAYEPVEVVERREIPGAVPLDDSWRGQRGLPKARLFLDSNRFAAWDLMCAIEEGRQPVSSVYTARWTVEMIQGIYASSLAQSTVDFPLAERRHPLGD